MTSTIKVNTITTESGSTLTVGGCGKTVALASGASQTGFGRTGTVDWETTKKTADFTAANGEGYFVDTSSGAVVLTLPASPSAGNIVAVKDYAYTFATHNCTIARNGSPIGGGSDTNLILDVNGTSKTFVYVDATKGWLVVNESDDTSDAGAKYVVATVSGSCNTLATCGDFKIATFKGPGTFCVSCAGNPAGNTELEYIVVAGGRGGGGAGGFRFASPSLAPATYPGKPRAAPAAIAASVQAYSIAVGGGGAGGPNNTEGGLGNVSTFSTITSAGGGKGTGGGNQPGGSPGGSGGGTYCGNPQSPSSGHSGNDPATSPPQGMPGGPEAPPSNHGSGGGGAMVAGSAVGPTGGPGGDGAGIPTAFGSSNGVANPPDSFRYYAGGGAGGGYNCGANGVGGLGGGGNAYVGSPTQHSGLANSGAGGGSVGAPGVGGTGGTGGSGIVIIRYKFQN